MAQGGNKPWQDFFNSHGSNKIEGRTFDDSTIQERYDSEAGEEWKDRLTAKIEGKEYVPGEKKPAPKPKKAAGPAALSSQPGSRSQTPLSRAKGSEMGTPRSNSPALGTSSLSKKAQNEAYFARMGAENLNRPEDLPPNQGGKYAGFGSDPFPKKQDDEMDLPNANDFQTDPVGALTKGFGWLGATVSRNAKVGYDGWVKPGMQKVCTLGSLVSICYLLKVN